MEIVFPIEQDQGIESLVHGHFGTAHLFMIVNKDTGIAEAIANPDMHHLSGQCQPLAAFEGKEVEAVVVGGIGGGAIRKLQNNGVKVYRAVEGTVKENMELIKAGKLPEFPVNQLCTGGCHHHHHH